MEATVEEAVSDAVSPPHSVENLIKAGRATRITQDTARDMINRRWERERAEKEAARNSGKTQGPTAEDIEAKARAKQERELRNAQEQVAMLSKRLSSALADEKTPPIDIERLQRSLSSAREDERKMSGRSLPPTLKAGPSKPQRQRAPMSDPT